MEGFIVDTGYKRVSVVLKIFYMYACPPSHNVCKWPKSIGLNSDRQVTNSSNKAAY